MLTVPQNPVSENKERGIDAVLTMPFSGFDLTTIVRKVAETRSAESARTSSLVVTLFSPKGGVGRTTLAYNIAVALGQRAQGLPDRRVAPVQRPARPPPRAGRRAQHRQPADRSDSRAGPGRHHVARSIGHRHPAGAPTGRDGRDGHHPRRREGPLAASPAVRVRHHRHACGAERGRARLPGLRRPDPPGAQLRQHGHPQPGHVGRDLRRHRLPRHQAGHDPEPRRCGRRLRQEGRRAGTGQPDRLRGRLGRPPGARLEQRGHRVRQLRPESQIAQDVGQIANALAAHLRERSPALAQR